MYSLHYSRDNSNGGAGINTAVYQIPWDYSTMQYAKRFLIEESLINLSSISQQVIHSRRHWTHTTVFYHWVNYQQRIECCYNSNSINTCSSKKNFLVVQLKCVMSMWRTVHRFDEDYRKPDEDKRKFLMNSSFHHMKNWIYFVYQFWHR